MLQEGSPRSQIQPLSSNLQNILNFLQTSNDFKMIGELESIISERLSSRQHRIGAAFPSLDQGIRLRAALNQPRDDRPRSLVNVTSRSKSLQWNLQISIFSWQPLNWLTPVANRYIHYEQPEKKDRVIILYLIYIHISNPYILLLYTIYIYIYIHI